MKRPRIRKRPLYSVNQTQMDFKKDIERDRVYFEIRGKIKEITNLKEKTDEL